MEDIFKHDGVRMAAQYKSTYLPLTVLHSNRPADVPTLAETRSWVGNPELDKQIAAADKNWAVVGIVSCQVNAVPIPLFAPHIDAQHADQHALRHSRPPVAASDSAMPATSRSSAGGSDSTTLRHTFSVSATSYPELRPGSDARPKRQRTMTKAVRRNRCRR